MQRSGALLFLQEYRIDTTIRTIFKAKWRLYESLHH
jgi:hypothetical protein